MLEFERSQRQRDDDLAFLEEANFTSDEEDMGITPSSFDILNQRFSEQEDIKIYLNMVGKGNNQSKDDEYDPLEGLDERSRITGLTGGEKEPSLSHLTDQPISTLPGSREGPIGGRSH